MFNTNVYFNNFDLSTLPGIRIVNYNVSDMPSRSLNASKLARANRSVLTSAEYTSKNVQVMGFVGGANHLEMQDNFDRLKSYIQEAEGIIRVTQGTKQVEYTGTLNGVSKNWGGPSMAFTLDFECSNPIGRDAATIALFVPQVITTSTLTKSMVVEGSFMAEPRFTITIDAVTGGGTVPSPKTITLLNAATGKGIKITKAWVPGDIVSIASDTMEVVVNTQIADFKGQFPTFLPGSRTLQYIDDFTTRSVTLSATYNRKYS